MRQIRCDFAYTGGGVRTMADHGNQGRRDPRVGLLLAGHGIGHCAFLLRQTGRDLAPRARPAGPHLDAVRTGWIMAYRRITLADLVFGEPLRWDLFGPGHQPDGPG